MAEKVTNDLPLAQAIRAETELARYQDNIAYPDEVREEWEDRTLLFVATVIELFKALDAVVIESQSPAAAQVAIKACAHRARDDAANKYAAKWNLDG